jgi:hypothetical protein
MLFEHFRQIGFRCLIREISNVDLLRHSLTSLLKKCARVESSAGKGPSGLFGQGSQRGVRFSLQYLMRAL